MVYTSGIWQSKRESLEQAQDRKLETVCRQLQLRQGDEMLDLGCGWGTLIRYAAKNFGVNATGVTLAEEQKKWHDEKAKKDGVEKSTRILVNDYRLVPHGPNDKKFDKISCLEMAEHVGIKNFQKFLHQVDAMLKDDGIFYLQIAGLRRKW